MQSGWHLGFCQPCAPSQSDERQLLPSRHRLRMFPRALTCVFHLLGFFYYFFHVFLSHHFVSFLLLTPLVGHTLGGRGPRGSASLVRALFSPLLCRFTPCSRKSPRALPFPGISGIWFLQIVRYGDMEVQAPQCVPWQEMALLKEFCKLWLHLQLLASCPC